LHLIRRLRLPAVLCALLVLACELLSRPFTTMGVGDDGPYIVMARNLATTGHFAYNGWAAPMIGWQLYIGAAFIKLFGSSFTAVRSSTVFIAMLMAFVMQRALVRAGISEPNATLGTLTLVLSPMYLMLSATYMTDIFGLFAVILCLYCCLRALHAATERSAIAWLFFAVLTNAICGTPAKSPGSVSSYWFPPPCGCCARSAAYFSRARPTPSPELSSSSPPCNGSNTSPTSNPSASFPKPFPCFTSSGN
jgi:hypothetical protein